jgi:hypothetical protein
MLSPQPCEVHIVYDSLESGYYPGYPIQLVFLVRY